MLEKIKKFIVNPFLDIYQLLKSDKTESILWLWFIVCALIMFVIYISNNYSLNLNLVGDAMWGIFWTLISTIVLIFVIESYRLQKEEIKKTTEALEGQENAMILQQVQSMVIEGLKMSNNHLRDLETFIKQTHSSWESMLLRSYIRNWDDLERDYKKWRLDMLLSYFQTLSFIEELITKSFTKSEANRANLLQLSKAQISKDIFEVYNRISIIDTELPKIKYLFQ